MAQFPANQENQLQAPDDPTEAPINGLVSFTAKYVEGVVYLKWIVKGEKSASDFLVERADADGQFVVIGHKDGYPAPNPNLELMYCFSDQEPQTGNTVYRIRQIHSEQEYLSSGIILDIDKSDFNFTVAKQAP